MSTCFCMGPQRGQPYCPCMMRAMGIYRRGDEWVVPERRIPAEHIPGYPTSDAIDKLLARKEES